MVNEGKKELERNRIDWMITLVPLAMVITMSVLFFLMPEQSNAVVSQIRFVLGDTFGVYYLVIGLGIFLTSLYIAGSKYGASQRNKFTDVESYERFCALRGLLKEQYNEQKGIEKLLKRKNVHKTDIRILTARQEVIEQEREDYR